MKQAFLTLLILAALGGGTWWAWQQRQARPVAEAHVHRGKWQCPMHPQIVRDEPGDCPICGMHLQKVEEEPQAPAGAKNGDAATRAAFTLSDERRQLIGVRSEAAGIETVTKTLRLPGRMGYSGVQAQALEMDGAVLKPGLAALVVVPGGRAKRAKVTHVDRSLDAYSRTFGVQADLREAPDPAMRPGVFVELRVELRLAQGVTVPKEAVLDTGARQVVFVAGDGGRFEPRDVELGAEGDALVEIKKGVAPGEKVVTSANFLIDSESRFQAAAQAFSGAKP
jgi:multidrug efflux pump subunit AcrA (membrane-fusion protein)